MIASLRYLDRFAKIDGTWYFAGAQTDPGLERDAPICSLADPHPGRPRQGEGVSMAGIRRALSVAEAPVVQSGSQAGVLANDVR